MTPLRFVAAPLAAKSGEAVKSGPIGFLVILLLCIACYFLFKSMSRHLKKVREDFPQDEPRTGKPVERPVDAAAAPESEPDKRSGPDVTTG